MEMTKLFHKDKYGVYTYNLYKIGPLYYFRGILFYQNKKSKGCSYCEIYRDPRVRGECYYIIEGGDHSLLCMIVGKGEEDRNALYPNRMELLVSSYIRANKLYVK